MPYLMDKSVQELATGSRRTNEHYSPSSSPVGISKSTVIVTGEHEFLCLIKYGLGGSCIHETCENPLNIIASDGKQKVYCPPSYTENTMYHIISSQSIDTPLASQSARKRTKAIPS